MKKIYSVLLITALFVSLIVTGCTNTSTVNQSGKDLVWYMIGDANKDHDLVMEEVSKITKEKINVGIKMYRVANADYFRKIQTMLNAGEEFDICFMNKNLRENAKRGSFVELGKLLPEYGKEMLETIPNDFFEMAKLNGNLYGIPTLKEIAWQNTWMVNVAIAKKYGIDYKKQITTLEEIEPILQKVKNGESNTFNTLMPFSGGMIGVLPFDYVDSTVFGVYLNFKNPNDKDYTIHNVFETPEAAAHLATMRRYYEKGFISRDLNSSSEAGKAGQWFLNLNSYQPEYEIADSAAKGYQVDVVYRHPPVKTDTFGALNAIPITSKQPEKALQFLNLVNTDKQIRNMIGYGIEAVHYTLNEQGKRVVTERGRDSYQGMPQYAIGNLFLNYLSEADRDGKWERFKEYNNTAIESPLMGFFFDSTSVKNEIAAIDNISSQYKSDLLFGRVDPSVVLKEYVGKMKVAGSDKVKAEMQKQLNEFVKSKQK